MQHEARLTFCGAGEAKSNRTVLTAKGWEIPDKKKQKWASFFSMVQLTASLSCLVQKLGLVRWDISKCTSFVLNKLFLVVHSFMSQMLSDHKVAHLSRFFDSAVSMVGVTQTVMVRCFAEVFIDADVI